MTTRMLREMDVVEADRIPQEWFLSAPPAQRILQVTDAVVAPSMDVRFAQDWRGLETLTKAGELIGWADGQQIRTPYDKRWEEHTSELQSLMRTTSAVFGLKKKKHNH